MRRLTLASVLWVLGCGGGPDPCAGIQSCISATVTGNVTGLDQLRVKFTGHGDMLSPNPAAGFELPVRLAIVVPAGTTNAAIAVEGVRAGQTAATSDVHMIAMGTGIPAAVETFTLTGGNPPQDAGGDGPPPGVVSFFPSSLDFGTAVRGTLGAVKPLTLFNNTDHQVNLVNNPPSTGDETSWSPTMATTCFTSDGGMNPGISLAPHTSCDIVFQFMPARAGSLKYDVTATFDDGETAGFTLTGKATPVWVAENVNPGSSMPPNLMGVFIAGVFPNQVFTAVGHDNFGATPIYRRGGQGNWNSPGGVPMGTGDIYSIFGADVGHEFLGGNSGLIWSNDGANAWSQQTSADGGFPGIVRGIWSRDTNVSFAVTDAGYILRYDGATGNWAPTITPVANQAFYAVCGHGQRNVAVGSQGIPPTTGLMWSTDPQGGSWTQSTQSVLTSASTLRGCWMSDDQNVWIVGQPSGGTVGFIVHCTGTPLVCGGTESPGSAMGSLVGISGRIDPDTNKPDIYVVGSLGNQVLHSDGSAFWAQYQIPNNQAQNAVFVTPDGEVMTVGYTGQVNHLY